MHEISPLDHFWIITSFTLVTSDVLDAQKKKSHREFHFLANVSLYLFFVYYGPDK